jgi:hypothetical protein
MPYNYRKIVNDSQTYSVCTPNHGISFPPLALFSLYLSLADFTAKSPQYASVLVQHWEGLVFRVYDCLSTEGQGKSGVKSERFVCKKNRVFSTARFHHA